MGVGLGRWSIYRLVEALVHELFVVRFSGMISFKNSKGSNSLTHRAESENASQQQE
jgi:hypothetical protein